MPDKVKILYIDDEPINTELFKINFTDNYYVNTASSGDEGLKKLEVEKDVDIVISDMKMPGMNGIEFISRAKDRFPDKKYFILTGYDISDEIRNAINDKLIIKYFKKPFDINLIDRVIQECIG